MSSQLAEAQRTPVQLGHRQHAIPIALVLVVNTRQMLTTHLKDPENCRAEETNY
jgi:hypothetical protein